MRILITNDDGIDAVGINVLAEIFRKDNDVIVIAPDSQRSACSHSLSIFKDLYIKEVSDRGYKSYAISGTPADCVKLGVLYICKEKPDLILSGINNGPNLGSDIMYSGTVAAALEGAYLGVKSFAVSLTDWDAPKEKYAEAANFLHEHYARYAKIPLPDKTVLNFNYPVALPCKGIKTTKVGINLYDDCFIENKESGGVMLQGRPIPHGMNDEDCDVEWSRKGFATVSPIHLDINDYKTLEALRRGDE